MPLNDMSFRSDIGLFRVLVIFLLLVFHSFCPYGNYWRDIGLDVPLYYWLDNWSYSFFLQGFIFISGYLYGIQLPKKKAKGLYNIKEELKKKFHRLMVPSLLYTSLYIILFREGEGWRTPYKIINGVGHLWFLPTLFGCFVCLLLIDRWSIKPKIVIIFSLLLSLIPLQGLPLRFDMVCKYFIFFYIAYLGSGVNYLDKIPSGGVLLLGLFQILLFVVLFGVEERETALMEKVCILPRLFELLYSFIGVFVLFSFVRKVSHRIKSMSTIKVISVANDYCFGVYIYQQFILWYLYYYTQLPFIISQYILPWLFLIITLVMSILLTYISKHIKYLNTII